jgi:hypothetical protein
MPGRSFIHITLATALLLCCTFHVTIGQINCSPDNLIGEWKETLSVPGVPANLDSLKTIASSSKKNTGVWNFMADKRYTYLHALWRSKYRRKGVYVFYADTCEIVLGTKANAREQANLEILYLDDRHLIYKSNNNPKGYFTHVLVRYTKKIRGR